MDRCVASYRFTICALLLVIFFVPPCSAAPFVRGDTDLSGSLEITDAIRTLGFLFLGSPDRLDCRDAADSDDTGELTITDGVYLLRFLFPGGPRPPAPFPECGEDLTADALDCESFPPCAEDGAPLPPSVSGPPSPTRDDVVRLAIEGSPTTTAIEVAGGQTFVETSTATDGIFSVDIPLFASRLHRLQVTALSSSGARSAPTTIEIIQDSTPPFLFIDEPAAGEPVLDETVTVVGRVSDLLSGFMGLDVQVAGAPANVVVGIGTNGTFERSGVPLALGSNEISVTATDIVGNRVTRNVIVERAPLPGDAPRLELVSGDGQQGPVEQSLAAPVVVRVVEPNGQPVVAKTVQFLVVRSNGRLAESAAAAALSSSLAFEAATDASGEAQVFWRLGTDAGCGNNRLRVTAAGTAGRLVICASAQPGPPSQINVSSGNNQRVETSAPAPERLRVWVSDGCNGIDGVPVTFDIVTGSGFVNNRRQAIVETTRTGHAEVSFLAGSEPGNQVVQTSFQGNASQGAVFTIFGVPRTSDGTTTLRGVVLDNARQPIGGARLEIEFPQAGPIATITNASGAFVFADLSLAGPAGLAVDGTVATLLGGETIPAGTFPALHYDIVVVPSAENTLPAPILLPPLDGANVRAYSVTEDTVLEVDGIDGLRMLVKAGSMTLSDGRPASDGTLMSLNQVHHDDIPMPMPDGAAPPFAWTLQPAGATFDPPIEITYPNMSGLPAGAVAYFLSFNHDTFKFEIVASGQVTADGAEILTDPGSGLTLAGWGGNCPPYPVTGSCESRDPGCGFTPGKGPDDCSHRFLRSKIDGSGCEPYSCGPSEREWLRDNWEKLPGLGAIGLSVLETVGLNVELGAYPEDTQGRVANAHRHIWWQCRVTRDFGIDTAEGWGEAHEVGSHPLGPCGGLSENAPCDEDHLLDVKNNDTARQAAIDPDFADMNCGDLSFDIATGQNPKYSPALFLTCDLRRQLQREAPRSENCAQAGGGAGALVPPCPTIEVLPAEVSVEVGEEVQLNVLLEDCAGNLLDRTSAADGTIYMLWDSAAEISDEGLITGLSPGFVSLVVVTPGPGEEPASSTVVPVTVYTQDDRDGDGIPNGDEVSYGLDPDDFRDSVGDLDGDDLLNVEEHRLGTRLDDADTDGDGTPDGEEVFSGLSDPLIADSASAGFQFSLSGVTVDANDDGTFQLTNVPAPDLFGPGGPGTLSDGLSDDPLRVVGVGVRGGETYYAYSEFFQLEQDATYVVDNLIVSTEPLPIPVSLTLTANPPVVSPEETVLLVVTGELADGQIVDLTQLESGTSYRTSNPAVATIGPDGRLEAHAGGRVFVTATHQGVTAVEQVIVVTDDTTPLTLTGILRLPDGSPAAGATITSVLGSGVTAAADGSFSIELRVPAGASVEVTAVLEIDGVSYSTVFSVNEIPADGTLDLGTVTLEPLRSLDFVGRRELLLASRPADFAVGDIDGDALLDLVVANGSEEDTASVYFATGLEEFSAPVDLIVGTQPESVVLADLDGDARLDVVTANEGSNDVSVVRSAMNRAFDLAIAYAATDRPADLAAGDFTGDGLPDLAVAGSGANSLALLRNNGSGEFEEATFPSAGLGGSAVLITQLDGTGPEDIVLVNAISNLRVFLALGDGEVAAGTSYSATFLPRGIAAGDVSGDQVPDLVVSDLQGSVAVLLGTGGGAFGEAETLSLPDGVLEGVAVADLDGNAPGEILVLDGSGVALNVYQALGDAEFSPARPYAVSNGPVIVRTGDFNGDGVLDAAVAAAAANSISFLRGDGEGGFLEDTHYTLAGAPGDLVLAQLDAQQGLDLVAAVPDGNVVSVLAEAGGGSFVAPVSYPGSRPTSVLLEDFLDDAQLDLAFGSQSPSNVAFLVGQGDGSFVAGDDQPLGFAPSALAAADLDGNGRLDIVAANAGAGAVSVLLATLDGGYETSSPYPVGANPVALAIGELDGTGGPDVVVGGSQVAVLFNAGGGTLDDALLLTQGRGPAGVGTGDFDGDGAVDLAVVFQPSDTVGILFNEGERTFSEPREFPAGRLPDSLLVVDLDRDGLLDLATASVGLPLVSLLRNSGGGDLSDVRHFGTRQTPGVQFQAHSALAVGDIDGDDRLDLAVGTATGVSVLLGR